MLRRSKLTSWSQPARRSQSTRSSGSNHGSTGPATGPGHRHSSLEGVGGIKTSEAYHSKADVFVIPEMCFFVNLPVPFFGNIGLIKFGTFSALLALPVMIWQEHGQIGGQAPPNILLSNGSLVTKSCIARFVDDDAFNPSALSDCSTGPSPPLAHGKSTLSAFQANACWLRPAAAFARFPNKRLIAVGKFERNVKYHLSMSSKLGFRVPRCNRNAMKFACICRGWPFFASHRASSVGNVAGD